ncbi:MAG: GAF domain-containing sensor histidine kinase [Chthoniobacteraceae bacterium]
MENPDLEATPENFADDIALIGKISAVPTILDVVCRTTGMGFAAVARVTGERWIACSVLDRINFGLKPGGELKVESTICHEIRESRNAVVIDHVSEDAVYRNHHTPRQYGFQSYISMPIILADGTFFGTLCSIHPEPAKVNTPEIIGMFKLFAELIAFHIDATDKLAHSESNLLAERETAELREQFIGVLGHDLRTPLNAISMNTALLKAIGVDEEQAGIVDVMKKSVSQMAGLIEDALDFTRGRLGGGIELDALTSEPLTPMLKQVVAEVQAIWPDRKIDSHFSLEGNIRYDRKRLSQLFINLLSNAMNHGNPDKPVRVHAVTSNGKLELSVSNAANPIPPAKFQRLFEPFSRGDSENYQKGLGLGLYIASQIAKSHGGTLTVSSDIQETRFTFTMNLIEATPAASGVNP